MERDEEPLIRLCNGTTQEPDTYHLQRREQWYPIDKPLGTKIYENFGDVTTTFCPPCYEKAIVGYENEIKNR